jgi:hypothetical protein
LKTGLKIDKSIAFLVSAVALSVATVFAAQAGFHVYKTNIDEKNKLTKAQAGLADLTSMKNMLFNGLPQGSEKLLPIRDVVSKGGVSIVELATKNNLKIGNVSVANALNNDDALGASVISMINTNDSLKEVVVNYVLRFETLSSLSEFVNAVPSVGGYVAKLSIKGNESLVSIKFIGA